MAGRTRTEPIGDGNGGRGSGGNDDRHPDSDRCNLSFTTPLQAPDPAVVAILVPGAELDIEVQAGTPYSRVVCKIPATGQIAGSLAAANELVDLITCWSNGHRYRGQVVDEQRPPMIRVYRTQRPA